MSNQTKKQYKSAYNVLQRITNKDMNHIIRNPKETYDMIKDYEYRPSKKYDVKSIKNLLTAILSYYKGEDGIIPCDLQQYHQQYLLYFRENKEQVTAIYDKNEPSEKQKKGVLKWEDVIKTRDELGQKEYGSKKHLLLSMYSYIPPLRQDFNEIKILTKTPRSRNAIEGNYIIMNTKKNKLILNEYKTSKQYGRFECDIPRDLVKIIKASLISNPREYLFTDLMGQPYKESNSYTVYSNRMLKEIFNNQAVSVSMLRHSYISNQDFNTLTEGQKKELAQQMAHSVSMQGQYRHITTTESIDIK